MTREFYFDWHWDLEASPQAIWPFAADTNRFNRDTGQPEVELLDRLKGGRRARMKLPVIRVEWEEEPFEWTYPYSFGVLRRYSRGPLDEMRVQVDLEPASRGGTHIRYQTWIKTGHLLARIGIPFAIGVIARRRFERAFRYYDSLLQGSEPGPGLARQPGLGAGSRARLRSLGEAVLQGGADPALLARLEDFLDRADELSLQRIRP